MESNTAVADRVIAALKNLNLKRNQKVAVVAKKSEGVEYIKISEKDIAELCN